MLKSLFEFDAIYGGVRTKPSQHGLEHRQKGSHPFRSNHPIPHRLKLLPATGIGDMSHSLDKVFFGTCPSENCAPRVEITICAPITFLQDFPCHFCGLEHDVPRIKQIPVGTGHSTLCLHPLV